MLENLHAYNFILVAVNLIILYLILKKILFKPVTAFMANRTQTIENSIQDAESTKREALELKRTYEEQMARAKSDGDKILSEAAERANRKYDELVSKAREEAELILQNARDEAAREHEQMLRDIRSQVVGLAIEAASKVLEENMDTQKNTSIVEKYLEKEGAA